MLTVMLYVLYGVLGLVFVAGVWRLRYAFSHFDVRSIATTPDHHQELPSVTVCIPARDETHAMTECLERVIASHYPKLEIIVLDDQSRDNTPSLIKAFARDGVRFVEGSTLPESWLGKNHALQGLLKEASGSYVLFLDVDTRLAPDSIGQLVEYAVAKDATMVSVMPMRTDGRRLSVLFSTLRYFWEVIFHRREAPATASNAWMIHRQTLLKDFGGFAPFKDAIQPESKLSAALMATNSYRFLLSDETLGVAYEKKWRSQIDTSIRLLFPLLGAKISHALVALLDLLIVASPLAVLIAGVFTGWTIHQTIAVVAMVLFAGLYASYLRRVRAKGWLIGSLLWPVIVLQEAVVLLFSMYSYRRGSVTWKGRTVTVPKQ